MQITRNIALLMFMLMIVIGRPQIGETQADDRVKFTKSGGGWESRAGHWKLSDHFRHIQGYEERPNDEVLKAVTVEWSKPEVDTLGNFCTIRGSLLIPGVEPGQKRPVKWFQGVTAYLANSPESKRDWSKGMDDEDSIHDSEVVQNAGEFCLRFDLYKVEYDRSSNQSFQFGLALAHHSGDTSDAQHVEWCSDQAAIASSVQMLEIPAAPKISAALEAVNAARKWPFHHTDGALLIRAVNALQPLGKERALATLEEFVKLQKDAGLFEDEIVFWIIRVLFEPVEVDATIPRPANAVHLYDTDLIERARWPLNPIVVIGEIPFMVGCRIFGSGPPEHPTSHILWARRHGVIIDAPLKPTMDPRAAAEELLNSCRLHKEAMSDWGRQDIERSVRQQALWMVNDSSATGGTGPKRRVGRYRRLMEDNEQQSDPRQFQWDEKRQEFMPVLK